MVEIRIIQEEYPWKVEIYYDLLNVVVQQGAITIGDWLNEQKIPWLGFEKTEYRSGRRPPIIDYANKNYGIYLRSEADAILLKLKFS